MSQEYKILMGILGGLVVLLIILLTSLGQAKPAPEPTPTPSVIYRRTAYNNTVYYVGGFFSCDSVSLAAGTLEKGISLKGLDSDKIDCRTKSDLNGQRIGDVLLRFENPTGSGWVWVPERFLR